MNQNKLSFDIETFKTHSNRIMLCTLLLLHNTAFDFKGHKFGHCIISPENSSISHNTRFVDSDGNEVEHKESFGNLQIIGNVVLDKDGKDLTIAHTIISTDLSADQWCAESLFHIDAFSDKAPKYLCKKLVIPENICISELFKLIESAA
jgi:hypothetical protein